MLLHHLEPALQKIVCASKGVGEMETIERFAGLMDHDCIETWCDQIFQFGRDMGYESTLLAIYPSIDTLTEAANAFLQTNFPSKLVDRYEKMNMGEIDPVVSHCLVKSTPLIVSPEIFTLPKQQKFYEEACSHGIRSGVALPIHGVNGEVGALCFASDTKPGERFMRAASRSIPELSCFRDYILETSSRFMKKRPPLTINDIELTSREIECLKWCATGKSTWDIAKLMDCTEATVNFHFTNLRRKFGASSRRMAVIKAMRMGFISL